MKFNSRLIAAFAILALSASPASAQLLGGGGIGGGLGGTLGGGLGGTLGGGGRSVTSTANGTLSGRASGHAERNVEPRSGRASGRASASGGLAGSLDSVTGSSFGSGQASGSGSASVSKEASFGVDGVGPDQIDGALGAASRTASGLSAPSLGGGGAGAGGSGSGSGQTGFAFGPLAAAGSLAANAAGALSVQPGMVVRDTAGRAIGEVQQLKTTARGLVDSVIVEVGDRLAALPAENFTVSGDALVSAMSRSEVRREARDQQTAD